MAMPLDGAVPVRLNSVSINEFPPASAPPMNFALPVVPPANNKPSLADTKYIKRGSYGCAVNPALPNKVNGEWKTFPDQISKLYFKPAVLEKAFKNSNNVYNLFGKNKGHKLNRYSYKNYKGSNLPKSVMNSCGVKSEEPLLLARMPHLGYDIASIGAHYKEYRSVPIDKILEQTLKVVRQLRDLAAAGKVHGDVRESNVMANPVTGDITIIDFDFLNTAEGFAAKYPFGFYSNPPESLLIDNLESFKSAIGVRGIVSRMEYIRAEALEYITRAKAVIFRQKYLQINEETLPDILLANKNYMVEHMDSTKNKYSEFIKMELPFFDSYGLGFTLLEFYYNVYNIPATYKLVPGSLAGFKERLVGEYSDDQATKIYNTIQKIVLTVLIPMCHLYLTKRITINEAHDRLSAIVSEYTGMAGGARQRKTLRKRKSHKRK